jgi:hypothetical protein
MKLILELKEEKWVNTENGHVSCNLHGALKEIFLSTGDREFRVEDSEVFITEDLKPKVDSDIVVDYCVVGETYEGE